MRECNYGELDGEHKSLVIYEEHVDLAFPEGESLKDVEKRMREFVLFLKENLAQFYNGYLGIDMMLYGSKSTNCFLHPCIEINLRMNMGIVSQMIHKRYFPEETKGIYNVKTFSSPKDLVDYDLFMRKKFPLKIESKKIMNGYLALTQIAPNSRSLAYLQSGIEEEVSHV